MASKGLLGRAVFQLSAVVFLLLWPRAAQAPDFVDLNSNLKYWLELIAADRPYLLIDRQLGELRLLQRRAVLRTVPILQDSIVERPVSPTTLDRHLRRIRPTDFPGVVQRFPFDWEDNLATMANGRCALFFRNGLLLFAHGSWSAASAPWIRIGESDLIALYNGVAAGTPLVILPPNWKHE